MLMFKIDRRDDCIWLTDDRGDVPVEIHFTPGQATLVSGKMAEAAKAGEDYSVEIEV
jgi:hypothetical protein